MPDVCCEGGIYIRYAPGCVKRGFDSGSSEPDFLFYTDNLNKRKMKKLLLIAFAALAFAACSDDDKTPTPPMLKQ